MLLLRAWWRERRFEGAALTLAAGLLLIASSVQQLFVFVMAITNRWEVDSRPFVILSIVAAALATAVWIALGTRRGRESLKRGASRPQRIHELEVLGAIARLSSQPGSVEQVGGNILAAAAPAVGADCAVLLLYDSEHRRLNAKAASGIPEDLWRTFEIEVSDTFNQTLLAVGSLLVVNNVSAERRLKMQLARAVGARSALVVPIRHEGRPVGTLSFYAVAAPRRFDSVAVAVAELIAKEAGDVLERTRLQEEVREERERATRVLAHIGDGVFFVDGTGVVRLWNPALSAITGLSRTGTSPRQGRRAPLLVTAARILHVHEVDARAERAQDVCRRLADPVRMMDVPDRCERRHLDALQQLADELRAREAVVGLERNRHSQLLGSVEHGLEPSRDVVELWRRAAEHANRRRAPFARQLDCRRQLAVERLRQLDRRVEADERHRGAGERRPDGATRPGVERQGIDRLSAEQAELEPVVAVLANRSEHSFERPLGRREVRHGDSPQGVVARPGAQVSEQSRVSPLGRPAATPPDRCASRARSHSRARATSARRARARAAHCRCGSPPRSPDVHRGGRRAPAGSVTCLARDCRLLEHLGRRRQVLRQGRFELLEADRLAHDLDPAAVADQLDALHARLDGRDRDSAESAVVVLDQRGRRVFGLHRLRAAPRQAPDRRRRPCEVTEQIERVGRLVHEHTAALARPRPAPARGAVVGVRAIERVDDRDAYELAESAGRDRASRAAAITGRKRCWKQTPSSRPARSAASIIVSASRASTASGFSTRTWAPASSASIASGG